MEENTIGMLKNQVAELEDEKGNLLLKLMDLDEQIISNGIYIEFSYTALVKGNILLRLIDYIIDKRNFNIIQLPSMDLLPSEYGVLFTEFVNIE